MSNERYRITVFIGIGSRHVTGIPVGEFDVCGEHRLQFLFESQGTDNQGTRILPAETGERMHERGLAPLRAGQILRVAGGRPLVSRDRPPAAGDTSVSHHDAGADRRACLRRRNQRCVGVSLLRHGRMIPPKEREMVSRRIPKVACALVDPAGRHEGYRLQVIVCPYCGQSHWHGLGDDTPNLDQRPQDFGHRVAHCDTPLLPNRAGYHLRWDGRTRGDQRKAARRRR